MSRLLFESGLDGAEGRFEARRRADEQLGPFAASGAGRRQCHGREECNRRRHGHQAAAGSVPMGATS